LTNPGHFVDLEGPYRLAPMATLATDRPGRPATGNRFGSVIFTRATDDAPRSLSDLKGRTMAAVSPSAFGGYLIAYHTLRRNGIDPERDLENIVYMGFPQSGIVHAVIDGEVDAGTVRTGIIEDMVASGQIAGDEIRLLNALRIPGFDPMVSTMLFPEWGIGAAPRLDP
ncbi:phosphate/phosphite/phosphonate ABC transporter substrate-binding protein, partial [Brevirhabdus pacifica]